MSSRVDPTQVAEADRLRSALAEAAARLDRLGDGSYMTEWSSSGEAGEYRYRCAYAREAAAAARAALTGSPRAADR